VLLIVTDVSKTGLISPSPAIARELCQRFPGWIDVLVDACQMRLSPTTMGAYADLGWMIAVTGSKFLTGPAFSGALFAPRKLADRLKGRRLQKYAGAQADWPRGWAAGEGQGDSANLGLLIRWEAAMAELRAFRAVPEERAQSFVNAFERAAGRAIAAHPALEPLAGRRPLRELSAAGGWDETPGIFPFLLKGPAGYLNPEQTLQVWRMLRQDLAGEPVIPMAAGLRVELGQPVAAGERNGRPVTALRLCASARLIVEACKSPAAAEAVLTRAKLAMAKAAWLAGEVAERRI
jgi:hypothetical protein